MPDFPPEFLAEIARFNADRRAALPTLDRRTIDAFYARWNEGVTLTEMLRGRNPTWTEAEVEHVFWGAIHKAITGDAALPHELRLASKAWLTANDYRSYDDGNLDL